MAANQATISVAVSVQNLAKVENLTQAFRDLRTVIIAMQRSTQGVSGMARAIRGAADEAARMATQQAQAAARNSRIQQDADTRARNADTARINALTKRRQLQLDVAKEANRHAEAEVKLANQTFSLRIKHLTLLFNKQKRRDKLASDALKRQERELNKISTDQRRSELERQRAAQKYLNALKAQYAAAAKISAKEAEIAKKIREQKATLQGRLTYYEKTLDAVFRAGYRISNIGNEITSTGQQIIGSLQKTLEVFGEFEFMSGRAAGSLGSWAIAGEDADKNFTKLQTVIQDTSDAIGLFQPEEVARALYFYASTTGQVVDSTQDLYDIMDSLTPIMKTAAMTQTDYETAIKGVYSIVAQFEPALLHLATTTGNYNLVTEKMNEITTTLFYVTQKTAAEFPDLINSFKMLGPVAAQAGASFDDMVSLLGRLSDIGIRGTMSGRALRQMFIQMVRPSVIAKKNLDALFNSASKTVKEFQGKSYIDIMFPKGEFVGTEGYINNLALALQNATQQERSFLLARISTANELPVLTALVNEQIRALETNGEVMDKTSDKHENAQKTFEDAWTRLSSSWYGTTKALETGIKNLQISLGRGFAEAIKPFIENLRAAIIDIRKWVDANPELVAQIGQIVAVIGGLAVAVGAVLSFVGALIGIAAASALIIKAFAPLFTAIGGFIALIVAIGDTVYRNITLVQSTFQKLESELATVFRDISGDARSLEQTLGNMFEPFRTGADAVLSLILVLTDALTALIRTLNNLGLAKPVLDAIITVMGIAFGVGMLKKILAIIGVTKLFAKTVTESKGLTILRDKGTGAFVVMEKIEKQTQRTGLALRTFDAIAASTGARMLTMQRSGNGLVASLGGILGTLGAIGGRLLSVGGRLAGFMLGPKGFIALTAVTMAVDNNIFGINDKIKSLTSSFRDFNKELNDSIVNFGDLSLLTSEAIAKTAIPQAEQLSQRINIERELFIDPGPAYSDETLKANLLQSIFTGGGVAKVTRTVGGHSFSVDLPIQGMMIPELYLNMSPEQMAKVDDAEFLKALNLSEPFNTALSEAEAQIAIDAEKRRGEIGLEIANNLQAIVPTVNSALVSKNAPPIDVNALLQKALNESIRTGVRPDIILEFYRDVYAAYGDAASPQQIASLAETFFSSRGIAEAASAQIVSNAFDPRVYGENVKRIGAERKLELQKELYKGIATQLVSAVESGDASQILKALTSAPVRMIGGLQIPAGPEISALPKEIVDSIVGLDVFNQAVEMLDPAIADKLGLGFQEDMGQESETSKTLSQKIQEKLLGDFYNAKNDLIGPIEQLIFDFVDELKVYAPKVWNENIGQITGVGEGARYTNIAKAILPDGRTVLEAYRAGDLREVMTKDFGAEYTDAVVDIVTTGIDLGIIDAGKTILKNSSEWDSQIAEIVTGVGTGLRPSTWSRGIGNIGISEALSASFEEQMTRSKLAGMPEGFRSAIIDAIENWSGSDVTTRKAFTDFITKSVPGGGTILSALRSDRIPDEIAGPVRQIIEEGVRRGLLDKSLLEEIARTEGAKTFQDVVGAFVEGFKSRKDTVKEIRKALKTSDPKRTKNLVRDMFGSLVGKATRPGASLEAQLLASEFLDTNTENITNALSTQSIPKKKRREIARAAASVLRNIDFSTLSPEQLGSVSGLIPLINSLITNDLPTPGSGGGRKGAKGPGAQLNSWLLSDLKIASESDETKTALTTTGTTYMGILETGVAWSAGGAKVGTAWGNGLGESARDAVWLWLEKIKPLVEGGSPPKKGPLTKIDRGGENIGKAWGEAFASGAMKSIVTGVAMTGKELDKSGKNWAKKTSITGRSWTGPRRRNVKPDPDGRSWTRPSMETNVPKGKKRVEISINVRGDGSINRAQLSELRRGVMDALVASDIEHMVEVT